MNYQPNATPKENAKHGYDFGFIKRPISPQALTKKNEKARKPIEVFDINLNYLASYESISAAAINLDLRVCNISRVLTKVRKSHKGMIFRYKQIPESCLQAAK